MVMKEGERLYWTDWTASSAQGLYRLSQLLPVRRRVHYPKCDLIQIQSASASRGKSAAFAPLSLRVDGQKGHALG